MESHGFFGDSSRLLVFLALSLPITVSEPCPSGWYHWEAGGACYWKSAEAENERRNFLSALSVCKEMDATLTSEKDEAEFVYINNTVRNCNNAICVPGDEGEQYWIGLYKDENLGSERDLYERRSGWSWINQDLHDRTLLEDVTSSGGGWHKWYDGLIKEPTGDDQCGRINYNGEWADRECTRKYRFICKKVIQPSSTTLTPPILPTKLKTSSTTKSPESSTAALVTIKPSTNYTVPAHISSKEPPTVHSSGSGEPRTSSAILSKFVYTTSGLHNSQSDQTMLTVYGVIGVLVLIIAVLVLVFIIFVYRKRERTTESPHEITEGEYETPQPTSDYQNVNNSDTFYASLNHYEDVNNVQN